MNVLALTTSSARQTVALSMDGVCRVQLEQAFKRRAPRRILRDLTAALAEGGLDWADLDLLAVDVGPGSFTGIRAGLATARALAFAHQLPCVGFTSLEIMAHATAQRADEAGSVERWFALPSRRTTCFLAHQDAMGVVSPPREVLHIAVAQTVPSGALILAPPSLCAALREAQPDDTPARLEVHSQGGPDAAALASLALIRAGDDGGMSQRSWAAVVPVYVAATDAERNLGFTVQAASIPSIDRSAATQPK